MGKVELIIWALLKYGPNMAIAIQKLFTVESPTDAQWKALWDLALNPTYEDYVRPPVTPPGS